MRSSSSIHHWVSYLLLLLASAEFSCQPLQNRRQHTSDVSCIKTLGGSATFDEDMRDGTAIIVSVDLSKGSYTPVVCNEKCWTFSGKLNIDSMGKSVGDEQVRFLSRLQQLRSVKLGGTSITGRSLARLSKLSALSELDLTATNIRDSDLTYLREMIQLTHLDLAGTAITDAGLQHLRSLLNLQVLVLDNTDVSDASLSLIGHLPRLEKVYLRDTNITQSAVYGLQSLRPGLEIVTERYAQGAVI